jgi:uncharacterized membrane protein YdbT with pleckstrin-like domain
MTIFNHVRGAVRETTKEDIVWEGHSSQLGNWPWFSLAVFGLGIGLLPLARIELILMLVPVAFAAYKYVETASHRYILKNTELEEIRGVFSRLGDGIDLHRIRDAKFSHTFMQRLAGIGNVMVISTDPTHPEMTLTSIYNPRQLEDALRRYSRAAKDRIVDAE